MTGVNAVSRKIMGQKKVGIPHRDPTFPFIYRSKLLYFTIVEYILSVSHNTIVFFFRAYDNLIEFTLTGTGRNQVTTNHVFLHTFQAVYLTIDSSFVQYLSSFLERCSRHEARCTQSSTSDTLQDLSRSCWDSIAYFYRLQVTTLQHTVFVAELASCYNLTRLQVL